MVFTQSGTAQIGYFLIALTNTIAGSFGQVVIVLFVDLYQQMMVFLWHAVTITDNDISLRHIPDSTIASHNAFGIPKNS